MMPALTLTDRPDNWRLRRAWRVAVDVEDQPGARLALIDVTAGPGAEGVTATFEWTADDASFGKARRIVPRGRRIRARIARTASPGGVADSPLFDGYVIGVRTEFGPAGPRVLLDAVDALRFHYDGDTLIGQLGVYGLGLITLAAESPLVFNEGGRGNRSQSASPIAGRGCFLFEHTPTRAEFWSAADAVNYLLTTRLASDHRILLPTPERLERLCGQVRLAGVDLTGLSLPDALERLAELSGCGFAIEPTASVRDGGRWRMRWFAAAGGRVVVLHHQPSGSKLSADTNVWAGSLAFPHDGRREEWVALGEPERVESTFNLLPAWNPALEGQPHQDYSRANGYFHLVADVHRRWVLNEAGDWSTPPFNQGEPPDLAGLFGTHALVLRRRRFLPCLSRDAAGKSLGVAIEVSYDSGATWQTYAGRVEVLAGEAGVRVADDQLPPAYWQAAVAGTLAVRVTATIESDARVRAVQADEPGPDDRRAVRRVRWLAGRFRRQWVHADSRFAGGSADAVDDRPALAAALAEYVRRHRESPARGTLTLPSISAVFQVGDRVRGIGGQGLSFNADDRREPREPLVRRVRHHLGDDWHTTLELE